MSLDYVIHTLPYHHQSAGIRALYKLADELRSLGNEVGIATMRTDFFSNMVELHPYEGFQQMVGLSGTKNYDGAIHVVPEGVNVPPAEKSVRWLLSDVLPVNGFMHVSWVGQHLLKEPHHYGRVTRKVELNIPRLAVDVIEKDLFYPGTGERSGLALYSGKYGNLDIVAMPGDHLITPEYPNTRAGLADILRSVEGLISYDNNSAINLEATICGTPVLMARGEMPTETIFGTKGIITDANNFYEASIEAQEVAADYDKVRELIKDDVKNFMWRCNEEWE